MMSAHSYLLGFSIFICLILTNTILANKIPVHNCQEGKARKIVYFADPKSFGQLSSGRGNQYVLDGLKVTKLQDDYHCAHTEVEENIAPWWFVAFDKPMLIDEVYIANPVGSEVLNWTVLIGPNPESVIRQTNDSFNCFKIKDSAPAGHYCGNRVARYLGIIGVENKPLVLCYVAIFAMDFTNENLALNRLTNQSSVSFKADSSKAVDGRKVFDGIFYDNWENLIPQCTHTNDDGEVFPWWMVDLENEYLVYQVDLYNRQEGLQYRLHDFEVRIGSADIREMVNSSQHFKRNPICVSSINESAPNIAELLCTNPLLGQFVSVQIVNECQQPECVWFGEKKNILTLCEVEVHGLHIVSNGEEKNMATNSELEYFNMENGIDVSELKHPWFQVKWSKSQIISKVNLILDEETEGQVPDFEIRIGQYPINSDYDNKLFKQNTMCYRKKSGRLQAGLNEIQCLQPLFGQFLTLQVTEPCDNDLCLTKLKTLLGLTSIQALSFKNVEEHMYLVMNKPTYQSSTLKNGFSSLALNGQYKTSVVSRNSISYCAETFPERNPWWFVQLWQPLTVEEVVVYLPGDERNVNFHDFEILVTNERMENISSDVKYDNESFVCVSSQNELYWEGENRFQCGSAIPGNYLYIRMNSGEENSVLNICEVEIVGCIFPDETDTTFISAEKENDNSGVHEFDYETFDK